MKSRLLSHIAFKFSSHPENVANESLCFILNSDDMVWKKILASISRSDLSANIIGFQSELSTDDNGRPDITGLGRNGGKPLIIEGKFWASLTPNQPQNYLKEIDEDGVLMFVCPEKRASRLKDELQERTGSEFAYIDKSHFSLTINRKTIVIIDWIRVLDLIEEYASLNNTELSNDVHQLRALCAQVDSEGFLPLSLGDLNEYHGRLCDKLSEVIDSVRDRLKKSDYIDHSGLKASAWRLGYGYYFRIHGFGCQLYFDAHRWYTASVRTPYWLVIKTPDWKSDRKLFNSFNSLPEFKGISTNDGDVFQVALTLKVGLDQEQLISHLAKVIDGVATVLERLKVQYPAKEVSVPAPVGE